MIIYYENAYLQFDKGGKVLMCDYLSEQIKAGNITQDEAEEIADEIIEGYQRR